MSALTAQLLLSQEGDVSYSEILLFSILLLDCMIWCVVKNKILTKVEGLNANYNARHRSFDICI